jgi:autotransporter-associated beta strand protein
VTANGIQFGGPTAAATTYDATSSAAIQLTSGSLYVGTAGITRTTGATALPVTIQLMGGTLGASQNWSSALHFKLGDVGSTIQAADSAGVSRNITLSGILSDDTVNGTFTKTGAGVLTLSGANTYTGATTVNEGTLVFGKKLGRSAASSVTVGANGGLGFGIHESDTTYFSKSEAAAVFNNPASSGVTLTTGAGIGMDVDSVSVSVDQTEVLSGSSSLVKSGSGSLILSGSNTYTGLTTVSAGDLVVNNANSLGSSAAGAVVLNGARLALSNATVTGESIAITGNGGTGSLGALRGDSGYSKWAGPIMISGAATLTDTRIGALSNATLEVSGVIDDGALDQRLIYRQSDSTAKIIVSGANTYSGPTSVAGGVVEISSFNSVVGGSPSSSLGAPLTPENGLVVISFLNVDGHLRYLGSGETTDRTIGVGNGTAATNFANATLEHNGTGGALVFSAPVFNIAQVGVTATSPRNLILSGSNSALNTIFGVIQDNVVGASGTAAIALTKQGAGTWILAGANTYSGPTIIGAGTLTLGANGVLPDNSPVSLGAATLRAATAGVETAATLDVTANASLQLGSGAQIAFADSSAVDWAGGALDISGSFSSGSSLRFGTTSAGLTATQLGLISASGFTDFALNAEGYLTATSTVLPSYSTWADDPAKGNIPGEPASGDFDADGLSNLLEYSLGTNPRVAAPLTGVLTGTTISYTKGSDAIANADVTWVIETSQTLQPDSWTAVVSQAAGDTSPTISHTYTPGSPARQFYRLNVTSIP